MKKIQIAVATTKKCRLPEDSIYLPMQVGAKGKETIGYLRDDTGDNISEKNSMYCELTAMYWLWKNSDADYCGVVHYRRFLGNPGVARFRRDKYRRILDRSHLEEELDHYDIILPQARIVITHGGPSSFIMPLQIGKIPIVVPRKKEFDEHVNDHQMSFCKAVVGRQKNIIVVEDVDKLSESIERYDDIVAAMPAEMKSNNAKFCEDFKKIVSQMFDV